jgi:hypothetical protein
MLITIVLYQTSIKTNNLKAFYAFLNKSNVSIDTGGVAIEIDIDYYSYQSHLYVLMRKPNITDKDSSPTPIKIYRNFTDIPNINSKLFRIDKVTVIDKPVL